LTYNRYTGTSSLEIFSFLFLRYCAETEPKYFSKKHVRGATLTLTEKLSLNTFLFAILFTLPNFLLKFQEAYASFKGKNKAFANRCLYETQRSQSSDENFSLMIPI